MERVIFVCIRKRMHKTNREGITLPKTLPALNNPQT